MGRAARRKKLAEHRRRMGARKAQRERDALVREVNVELARERQRKERT